MNNPIVDIGGLAKPVTVFIEKVSAGLGCLYEPRHIVKVAEAEAKANKIRVAADIEIAEMEDRAIRRLIGEETKRQANIEGIIHKALLCLDEEKAEPEKMDDDWIAHFFDKCRSVSNEEMQRLWAKVLAGEANAPGSFSRKTVNLIADLNARDANLFTALCRFSWQIGNAHFPLIFGTGSNEPGFSAKDCEIYQQHGIVFDTLRHLEALGLLQFGEFAAYSTHFSQTRKAVLYFGRMLLVEFQSGLPLALPVGHVLLTNAGSELAPFSGATPIDGYFEFVEEKWPGLSLSAGTSYKVTRP